MSANLTGFDKLNRTLLRMSDPGAVLAGLRPQVQKVGADRLKRAKQLAPRMDGILVNSGYVHVDIVGQSISLDVGFSAPYARAVHENPRSGRTGGVSPRGKKYRKWARVGGYRYLQRAVDESDAVALDQIGEGIAAWLRRQAS